MQIARTRTGALLDRAARNNCSNQGSGGDQTEALMDREHVRTPVELRLLLGAATAFGGRETEVRKRRFARGARRRIRQILLFLRWTRQKPLAQHDGPGFPCPCGECNYRTADTETVN